MQHGRYGGRAGQRRRRGAGGRAAALWLAHDNSRRARKPHTQPLLVTTKREPPPAAGSAGTAPSTAAAAAAGPGLFLGFCLLKAHHRRGCCCRQKLRLQQPPVRLLVARQSPRSRSLTCAPQEEPQPQRGTAAGAGRAHKTRRNGVSGTMASLPSPVADNEEKANIPARHGERELCDESPCRPHERSQGAHRCGPGARGQTEASRQPPRAHPAVGSTRRRRRRLRRRSCSQQEAW